MFHTISLCAVYLLRLMENGVTLMISISGYMTKRSYFDNSCILETFKYHKYSKLIFCERKEFFVVVLFVLFFLQAESGDGGGSE